MYIYNYTFIRQSMQAFIMDLRSCHMYTYTHHTHNSQTCTSMTYQHIYNDILQILPNRQALSHPLSAVSISSC